MSGYVKPTANGRYQQRLRHPLLTPKGEYYATFDDEADARCFGEQLERLLARGVLPVDLLRKPEQSRQG